MAEIEKELIIADVDENNNPVNPITVGHGTSIKIARETSSNSTVCFDDVLTKGNGQTPWTIDAPRVSYEGLAQSMELEQRLEKMVSVPGMVTVREIVRPQGERPYVKKRNFFNVIVDGEDYELKPDDYTVNNLKFKAGRKAPTDYKYLDEYDGN